MKKQSENKAIELSGGHRHSRLDELTFFCLTEPRASCQPWQYICKFAISHRQSPGFICRPLQFTVLSFNTAILAYLLICHHHRGGGHTFHILLSRSPGQTHAAQPRPTVLPPGKVINHQININLSTLICNRSGLFIITGSYSFIILYLSYLRFKLYLLAKLGPTDA